jgi:hypothetical protein
LRGVHLRKLSLSTAAVTVVWLRRMNMQKPLLGLKRERHDDQCHR